MLSSVLFLNSKGDILINKSFKDDIPSSDIQDYCSKVIATKQYKDHPILLMDGVSYICVPHRDMILVGTTKTNVNCAMVFEFLYKLIKICQVYFQEEVGQADIRKNFTLMYEILDETMDFGCPQYTEAAILKDYILNHEIDSQKVGVLKNKQLTAIPTGQISWRPEGIVHKKNSIYIDVIEEVNALFSAKGTVLRTDINGSIKMTSQLSGMPQCKLGMNDKLLLEKEPKKSNVTTADRGITIDDMKFHQCVRLSRYNKEGSITFIPPDGPFELMSYRVSENINLPFKIMPVYNQIGKNKLQIKVKIKSIFQSNLNANNVVMKIPCPKGTVSAVTNSLVGKAKYQPQNGAIMWRIKKFQGDFECSLQCEVLLSEQSASVAKPPISLQFSLPMFTGSGLRIRFLKIHENKLGYTANKYHKALTKSGIYEHRL